LQVVSQVFCRCRHQPTPRHLAEMSRTPSATSIALAIRSFASRHVGPLARADAPPIGRAGQTFGPADLPSGSHALSGRRMWQPRKRLHVAKVQSGIHGVTRGNTSTSSAVGHTPQMPRSQSMPIPRVGVFPAKSIAMVEIWLGRDDARLHRLQTTLLQRRAQEQRPS
jgi:hypothetical protein